MATLEVIAYRLRKERGLGKIVETGSLDVESFPWLKPCSPRLLEAAETFLVENDAWGTAWSIRDSDAEADRLTFRWENTRARISLIPGVPHPLFCVSSPDRFLDSWIGEPKHHELFASHIQHYRWDGGGRRLIRPLLLAGKTMSECVALGERIAREGNPD